MAKKSPNEPDIQRNSKSEKHHEGMSEGLNEGLKTVLGFIGKAPDLRAPQISKALDIPVKTLERQIRKLKEIVDPKDTDPGETKSKVGAAKRRALSSWLVSS